VSQFMSRHENKKKVNANLKDDMSIKEFKSIICEEKKKHSM